MVGLLINHKQINHDDRTFQVGLLINHKQINHDDRAFHNNSVYQHRGSTTMCAAALGLPNLATIDTLYIV